MSDCLMVWTVVTAVIIYVMFTHYIGDFILQTAWMANGKSKSLKPLATHIAVYTSTLILMGIPLTIINAYTIALPLFFAWWVVYCVVNGLCHFATDFVTSKASSKAYADGNIRKFWAIIGFDQFIHMATFWLVLLAMVMLS